MNILTYSQRNISTNFLIAVTMMSLFLSALPLAFFVASAATTLSGPDDENITAIGGEYASGTIDASTYENLVFSFDYDSTKLDDSNDSFTFGWRDGVGDNNVATVIGMVGDDVAEVDSISVTLPLAAQVSDLEVYVYVTATPENESDIVKLTNITVEGDEIVVMVHGCLDEEALNYNSEATETGEPICEYTDETGLATETCEDGIQNQDETDTDEGGMCESVTESDASNGQCEIEGHKYDEIGTPLSDWIIGLEKVITQGEKTDIWNLVIDETDSDGYFCLEWDGETRDSLRGDGEPTITEGDHTFIYRVFEKMKTRWQYLSIEAGADSDDLTVVADEDIAVDGEYVSTQIGVENGYIYADAAYHVDFYNEGVSDQNPELFIIEGYKFEKGYNYIGFEAGWTIFAENTADATSLSTTTDSNGYYYFEVEGGEWKITEEMKTDWAQVEVQQNNTVVSTPENEVAFCDFDIPDEVSEYTCDFYNEYDSNQGSGGGTESIDEEVKTSQVGSSGTRIKRPEATPQVLGVSTQQCGIYLFDYLKKDTQNDSNEVFKLQYFLNGQGHFIPATGVFDTATDEAVRAFQLAYQDDILTPWMTAGFVTHNNPTGWVYQLTKWKINNIVCPDSEPLPILIP